MASGMGMRGTVGRCFGFFQDLQKCALELQEKKWALSEEELVEGKKKCGIHRADYMECLHGEKTIGRAAAIARAEKEAAGGHGH